MRARCSCAPCASPNSRAHPGWMYRFIGGGVIVAIGGIDKWQSTPIPHGAPVADFDPNRRCSPRWAGVDTKSSTSRAGQRAPWSPTVPRGPRVPDRRRGPHLGADGRFRHEFRRRRHRPLVAMGAARLAGLRCWTPMDRARTPLGDNRRQRAALEYGPAPAAAFADGAPAGRPATKRRGTRCVRGAHSGGHDFRTELGACSSAFAMKTRHRIVYDDAPALAFDNFRPIAILQSGARALHLWRREGDRRVALFDQFGTGSRCCGIGADAPPAAAAITMAAREPRTSGTAVQSTGGTGWCWLRDQHRVARARSIRTRRARARSCHRSRDRRAPGAAVTTRAAISTGLAAPVAVRVARRRLRRRSPPAITGDGSDGMTATPSRCCLSGQTLVALGRLTDGRGDRCRRRPFRKGSGRRFHRRARGICVGCCPAAWYAGRRPAAGASMSAGATRRAGASSRLPPMVVRPSRWKKLRRRSGLAITQDGNTLMIAEADSGRSCRHASTGWQPGERGATLPRIRARHRPGGIVLDRTEGLGVLAAVGRGAGDS